MGLSYLSLIAKSWVSFLLTWGRKLISHFSSAKKKNWIPFWQMTISTTFENCRWFHSPPHPNPTIMIPIFPCPPPSNLLSIFIIPPPLLSNPQLHGCHSKFSSGSIEEGHYQEYCKSVSLEAFCLFFDDKKHFNVHSNSGLRKNK